MVKKIRLCFVPGIVFLAISLITVSAFGGGMALSGIGAKAISMGGAFRGLADDATAMYWNPAGLANMEDISIDLGGTFIMPSGDST